MEAAQRNVLLQKYILPKNESFPAQNNFCSVMQRLLMLLLDFTLFQSFDTTTTLHWIIAPKLFELESWGWTQIEDLLM